MKLRRQSAILLLIVSTSGLLAGQKKPATVTDDLGNVFPLSAPPHRIISLAPNITEILFALGLDSEIAGVTRYCDYPERALKKEKVGGIEDPNLEKILSLKPDLIIAFRGISLRLIGRMKETRVPVFILDEGARLEDIFRLIDKIGRIVLRENAAAALIAKLRSGFDRTTAGLAKASRKPKIFLSIQGSGLYTCGPGTFLHDFVEKAVAENAAGSLRRGWLLMNREEFISGNPEVIIILAKTPQDFENGKAWFRAQPGFGAVAAVREGRFIHLDENITSRFGPRLFEAFYRLASIIHPEAFSEFPPKNADRMLSSRAKRGDRNDFPGDCRAPFGRS